MNTRVHGKVISLSYQATVIFEQLILFFKGSFPANVFHEIKGINDALTNAHGENEQTILNMYKSIRLKQHLNFTGTLERLYAVNGMF